MAHSWVGFVNGRLDWHSKDCVLCSKDGRINMAGIVKFFFNFFPVNLQNVSAKYAKIDVAAYQVIPERLIVWANNAREPSPDVMFMITQLSILNLKGAVPWPSAIITDGEKWCPIICGNAMKWHSYPTGYHGIMLTTADQREITALIERYCSKMD